MRSAHLNAWCVELVRAWAPRKGKLVLHFCLTSDEIEQQLQGTLTVCILGRDVHIWLDPQNASVMVKDIAEQN